MLPFQGPQPALPQLPPELAGLPPEMLLAVLAEAGLLPPDIMAALQASGMNLPPGPGGGTPPGPIGPPPVPPGAAPIGMMPQPPPAPGGGLPPGGLTQADLASIPPELLALIGGAPPQQRQPQAGTGLPPELAMMGGGGGPPLPGIMPPPPPQPPQQQAPSQPKPKKQASGPFASLMREVMGPMDEADAEKQLGEMYGTERPVKRRKPKRPQGPTPKLDALKVLAEKCTGHWRPRDDRMDKDFLMYSLSREGFKGKGELVLRNVPYVLVEKAASLLGKQKPSFDVVPAHNKLRDKAQQIEDYLRYLWEAWDDVWTDLSHNNLRRDLAHYLALRGWATVRVTYTPPAEEDDEVDPDKQPVFFKPIDPRQVYPGYKSDGLKYVFRQYWTSIDELCDEWPEAKKLFQDSDKDGDPTTTTLVTAYYDDWYHAVWCDRGDIKKVTPHEYGFVPWLIMTSYGPPGERTTVYNQDWTELRGTSIFHGLRDAYWQLNRILSQLATEVAKAANPAVIYYYDPALGKPQPVRTNAGSNNFMVMGREKAEMMHLDPSPASAKLVMDALVQDHDMAGLPPILFGVGGNASGYAQTMMGDHAEDILSPIINALVKLHRRGCEYALRLIRDHHTGDVGYYVADTNTGRWVGGVKINADIINQVGTKVRVTFKSVGPRDKIAMGNLAIGLTDRNIISLETARDDYVVVENPQRENDRILSERVYLNEKVIDTFSEMALKKADPEAYKTMLVAQLRNQMGLGPFGMPPQAQPGGGMPGGGGPPGLPGLPPTVMSPIEQSMQSNPMAGLIQSLGSAQGGASAGPLPGGIPLPPM